MAAAASLLTVMIKYCQEVQTMLSPIHGRKPNRIRIVVIAALLLVLGVIALPAGATPPEPLDFEFNVSYYDLPTDTGYGTWESGGLLSSSGSIVQIPNHAGWDPDGCWRTVHTLDTLTGASPEDTITIRTQLTEIDGVPGCFSFTGSVNWTIVSATGAYAGLHGQGKGTVSGYLDFAGDTINYVINSDLNDGQGHYEP
jgi:hypothetical protein